MIKYTIMLNILQSIQTYLQFKKKKKLYECNTEEKEQFTLLNLEITAESLKP